MEREKILQTGKVTLRVTIAGMWQRQDFFVEREETAFGKIPFLVCRRNLPLNELVRISEESQLPVKCSGQKVFPKKKGPKDFVGV